MKGKREGKREVEIRMRGVQRENEKGDGEEGRVNGEREEIERKRRGREREMEWTKERSERGEREKKE